jgi:predicted DNA-binding ribbon-helix-helix protein
MKSPVLKRSIVVGGHKTSVSLEDEFWQALKQIAAQRDLTLGSLVAAINADERQGNLSSTIRLFVLDYYRSRANPAPDTKNTRREGGAVSPAA